MATVVEIQTTEGERALRRPYFSAIRWGAIFAGVVAGSASYLLLSLLGVAVGLTAIDSATVESTSQVPLATGVWTGVSMLVGAFLGGYVAGHMSGLARAGDGMLHGFVSWAATTLLFGILTVSAVGTLLGGTFRLMGQALQNTVEATSATNQNILDQLAARIAGGQQITINPELLKQVQQALAAGDTQQAVDIMVQDMGVERERAEQLAGTLEPLMSRSPREIAGRAADALTVTSWWLFIGLLLSLAFGVAGGATGTRATSRRVRGDHVADRRLTERETPTL